MRVLDSSHNCCVIGCCCIAWQLKGKIDECNEAAELTTHQQSARYNKAASELVQRDTRIQGLQVRQWNWGNPQHTASFV